MFAKSHFSGSPSSNVDTVRDLCEKLYQISKNKEKVITNFGEKKYLDMMDKMNDQDKIIKTPTFFDEERKYSNYH